MKRSTSSRTVSGPKLTRITSSARASSQPIAFNTGLVLSVPDEQAAPADTEMPAMSKRISCTRAATPGMR